MQEKQGFFLYPYILKNLSFRLKAIKAICSNCCHTVVTLYSQTMLIKKTIKEYSYIASISNLRFKTLFGRWSISIGVSLHLHTSVMGVERSTEVSRNAGYIFGTAASNADCSYTGRAATSSASCV